MVTKDLPTKSLFHHKLENFIKSPTLVSGSISRLCEFLVVLVHGFHYLSDCSPSPCVSSPNFAVCPAKSRDFGLKIPPGHEQPAQAGTTACTKWYYRSAGTTAWPKRYFRPVFTSLLRFSFRQIPLLFGCAFLGDFCLDNKLPQIRSTTSSPRLPSNSVDPTPVAHPRSTLQRYTLQP